MAYIFDTNIKITDNNFRVIHAQDELVMRMVNLHETSLQSIEWNRYARKAHINQSEPLHTQH